MRTKNACENVGEIDPWCNRSWVPEQVKADCKYVDEMHPKCCLFNWYGN